MSGGKATVARWTRYGHDRLYVTGADGTRLGWVDAKTGAEHVEVPDRVAEFHAALTDSGHRSGAATGHVPTQATPQETSAVAGTAAPHPGQDWHDLALNRPGQAAREQAQAHLAAQRSRSRLLSAAARALDIKTDERAWRKGAEGEETVGQRLERLHAHGWHVLHAVGVGSRGSDIDHVLIGPGGVFTVNTKNHPGKSIWVSPTQIRVDGHVQPYLRNSRFEAERTARLLSAAVGWAVPVRAVLVLLTGTLLPDVTIKSGGPPDVLILDRLDIPRVFKKASLKLSPEQVEQVFAQARRSTVWL